MTSGLGIGLLTVRREVFGQWAAGLQHALQARDHHRPAAGNVAQRLAAFVEIVMRYRELDYRATRLDVEGDARHALLLRICRAGVPGVGEPFWRIRFQHLAFDARRALPGEPVGRADFPVGRYAMAEPVALGEVTVGQRMPELFGGGVDIGGVD